MQIITGKQVKPLKAVIYGPEGVGKSSLAKGFPRALFIDVEGGTSRLDVARTPRPTSWPHFLQILSELAKNPMGYETLVIDTADWLEKLGIRQVLAETGFRAMGGNKDFGQTFNQLADMWSSLLTQIEVDFIDSGKMHVVFLAHSTTKKFELPEEQGAFDRYQLDLEKKVAPSLREWADMVLFLNYQTIVTYDEKAKKHSAQGGSRRMMYSERTAAFDAKNRDELPREMDLGFAPIAKCFCPIAGSAPAPVSTPAPAAAPAPVQQQAAPVVNQPALPTAAHQNLAKLMADSGVTYDQVVAVLAFRGKYPKDTPLENLDPAFIEGWMNKFWGNILETINASAAA